MNIFILFFILFSVAFARPYVIQIVTDSSGQTNAENFISRASSLEPFKQLIEKKILKFEIPKVLNHLKCRGGNSGIPRLAQCDLTEVKQVCNEASLCPVLTSFPDIGAGAQRYPIVSTSFPWTTMLHEMVHTFNFTDEYAYTKSEAPLYCQGTSWINGSSQIAKNEFPTNEMALEVCKKNIPWCQTALNQGAIVTQKIAEGKFKIGSSPEKCPNTKLGVYLGGSCQQQNSSTWRPYFCPTVMGYPSLGEDTCNVKKRHAIIEQSPNLLPLFYQKAIFNKIVAHTNNSQVSFEERDLPNTENHVYGIPEVDKLSGSTNLPDYCH